MMIFERLAEPSTSQLPDERPQQDRHEISNVKRHYS